MSIPSCSDCIGLGRCTEIRGYRPIEPCGDFQPHVMKFFPRQRTH